MQIDETRFGSITIDGKTFEHDIVIRLSGEIIKRKKKLSKKHYGSSHTISEEEARFVYEAGGKTLILGTGQYGRVQLSDEAAAFLAQQGCTVVLLPTPEAIRAFNSKKSKKIGLFHVTC
ncbi:MAG: hypothetical protein GY862_28020 [Gammaproteobacteria bacterium]|nr:hypothetical protein [Gammaproteobacteria bacterium]